MRLRFDCVFQYVARLDAAVPFYRDVLEFTLESQDAVARFDIDGVRLELVPDPSPAEHRPRGGTHLCLAVDDIDTARRTLQARGVAVAAPTAVEGGRIATFEDLDGNAIYLWESA